jgi:hypothetical protein
MVINPILVRPFCWQAGRAVGMIVPRTRNPALKTRCFQFFRIICLGLWLLLFMAMLATRAGAQEALRLSLAGDVAAANRHQADTTSGYYNLLWGPVALRFSSSAAAEYRDNVRNSTNGGGDLLFLPSVNTEINWPVTEQNTLHFSLNGGYSFYAQHSELNNLYLSPGSGLSFEIYIKDWVITLHDQATVTESTYENPASTGRQNDANLQNDAGISGMWDLNKLVFNIGFDHVNYSSLSSGQSQPDSASENFSLNAAVKIRPEILVGLEGGLGLINYENTGTTNLLANFLAVNSALQWNAGVFSSVQVSEHLSARLDVGYTVYTPNNNARIRVVTGTNSLNQTNFLNLFGSSTALYFQFSLSHVVNEHVNYTLTAGHSVDFAYNGSPTDRYFVQLDPRWNFIRHFEISPTFGWEHGSQQLTGGSVYDQYNGGLSIGCPLTAKLSTSAYYRWVQEVANQSSLNYTANIVGLSLSYQF